MSEFYADPVPHEYRLPWDADDVPSIAADLKRHAVKLAALRVELSTREAGIKEMRRHFEASITDQLRNAEALRREVDATEDTVRALAIVEHETSGTTKPCPGVSVVMSKEYAIDEAAALAWAKVTRMCLVPESVDLRAVRKMATVTELPFVAVTERPSVRVASDLLAALEAA